MRDRISTCCNSGEDWNRTPVPGRFPCSRSVPENPGVRDSPAYTEVVVQEPFTCGEVRYVIIMEATFSGNGPLSTLTWRQRSFTCGKALWVSPNDHDWHLAEKSGTSKTVAMSACAGARGGRCPRGVSGGGRSGRRFRHARSPAGRCRWIRSRACR